MKPAPIYTSQKENERVTTKSGNSKPLLSIATKLTGRAKTSMVNAINKYRGVPYLWGGESKKGLDCSGFTMLVYKESVGITIPRKAALQYKQGKKIGARDLRFGDLVFFRDIENRGISHVGIYIGSGKFVHASLSNGVVDSLLEDRYYKRRFVGAKRILK